MVEEVLCDGVHEIAAAQAVLAVTRRAASWGNCVLSRARTLRLH